MTPNPTAPQDGGEKLVEAVARAIAPERHRYAPFGLKRARVMAIDEIIARAAIDAMMPVVRNEALEEAAVILDAEIEAVRACQKSSPLDNFLRGQINSALRMRDAIRALQQKGPSNG